MTRLLDKVAIVTGGASGMGGLMYAVLWKKARKLCLPI